MFPNNFAKHHVPRRVFDDLCWWKTTLLKPALTRSLTTRRTCDPDIWVDASTDWGIGIVVGGRWVAWKLCLGWKAEGRDIGWAEAIALELAVLWLEQENYTDAKILIQGDNTGVIGTFIRGRSRNILRNDLI